MNLLRTIDGPWGRRLFFVGLLMALLVTLFLRVRYIPYVCLNTGGYDQNVIYGIVRVLDGEPLYSDPEAPPFAIIQYAPLHTELMALGCRSIGLQANKVQAVYVVTRIVSLLFTLLTCLVLYRLCRRLSLSRITAFGIMAFFLAGLPAFCYMRPDATYMFWFFLHLLAFLPVVRAPRGTASWGMLLWPALLAAIAVYTKQTGLITLVITGGFLLFQRRWSELVRYALLSALFGISGLYLLHIEGGLEMAYKNIVLGTANGIQPSWMLDVLSSKYALVGMGWMVLGVIAARKLMVRNASSESVFIGIAAPIALGWGLLTGLKQGMNVNYFTENYVLSAIAVAWWVERAAPAPDPWIRRIFLGYLPFVALFKTAMYFSAFEVTHYFRNDPQRYADERSIVDELEARGAGYVFLTDRGFTELFLPYTSLLSQKDIKVPDTDPPRLDRSELFRMAEDGRLRYLMTPVSVTTPSYEGIAFQRHKPIFERGRWRVWEHEIYMR